MKKWIVLSMLLCATANAGCNTDEPIVVGSNKIKMRLAPCGPSSIAPDYFEVIARAGENETAFNLPANPVFGSSDVLLELFRAYLLREGDNRLEYRAMSLNPQHLPGGTDVVTIRYLPPTPTPTPEATPTPTPISLGRFTVIEIEVEP